MQIFSSSFLSLCATASKVGRVVTAAFLLCAALAASGQALKSRDRALILQVMADQEGAWNKGDLEGFMQGYWHDDSLRFIGKSGITYGWQATLDNYKRGYPDLAAMGHLSFTILRVESLGRRCAYVTGAWHLQRDQDAPQGYYTLLWRKLHGTWVIVADHSS
jgi:ketosteroid isomerase-like protein